MKLFTHYYSVILLSALLAACNSGGGDTAGPAVANGCDTVFNKADVYIVDLSQHSTSGVSCTMTSERDEIVDCVERGIRETFAQAEACLGAFDVFVPGTNQEDGDYRQFTSIISPLPGRTYLSVQYSDESTLLDDAMQYDRGVADASNALDLLLYTLKARFNHPDVRVFGHSKGSDAVARVSAYPDHQSVKFFAFAQAGRTPDSLRGTPGYIQKLRDNLVGLSWQNDEVKFYTGGSSGFVTPEIWGFPGYVNQTGDGLTVFPIRIDHHNNYGGDYSKEDYPYCATGNKAAMLATSECRKQAGVNYLPYFWGTTECADRAYEMMDSAPVGDQYYIGYSGPRAPGCKDTSATIEVSYELVYRMNLADQDDCRYNMQLSFEGLDSGENRADGGSISVSSTRDTRWVRRTGRIQLPYHMKLVWRASMDDVSGRFSSCINYLGAQSEGYIDTLKVSFTHPVTGEPVNRTLMGNAEGIEYFWPQIVTGRNNVGWRKTGDAWNLHYGIPPTDPTHGGALMVKGDTGGGYAGVYYKWVHLLD